MTIIEIILGSTIIVMLLLFMVHQELLFARLVEQNNKILIQADKRLDRANEMVLTLTHSADLLSESVREMKDLSYNLTQSYEAERKVLTDNRDEYREAYGKLLKQFEAQREHLRQLADEDHRALKELASRPTINNN